MPNSSIFSAHPQPVPGPESACAEEVEEILGFKKRSYVRDVNGREGSAGRGGVPAWKTGRV